MRKAEREARKAQVTAWRAEIDEIKADTNLTDEQKKKEEVHI